MVNRIYAQYSTEPKAVEWYNIVPTISDELLTAYDDIKATYDIDSQAGEQLDVIGRVVVQPRNIDFPVDLIVAECGDDTKECGDSTATEFSALTGLDNTGLTDEQYKPVLKSKIQINTSDVTIDGIITAVNTILSNSFVSQLNDNEDMTFDIVITGTLTATEISLLNSVGFIPKPQGVGFGGYSLGHTNLGVFSLYGDYPTAVNTAPRGVDVNDITSDVFVVSQLNEVLYISVSGANFVGESISDMSNPNGITINESNGDRWVADLSTNLIFKQTGGTGSWIDTGGFLGGVGSNIPNGVAINSNTGDVWAFSKSSDLVYKNAGGVGTWDEIGSFPTLQPNSISVNDNTGDVWVADAFTTGVWVLYGGTGTFESIGSFPGNSGLVTVDKSNGDVWVLRQDVSERRLYLLAGGVGTFTPIGTYQGDGPADIDIDSTNGDIFITNTFGPTGEVYKSPGVAT